MYAMVMYRVAVGEDSPISSRTLSLAFRRLSTTLWTIFRTYKRRDKGQWVRTVTENYTHACHKQTYCSIHEFIWLQICQDWGDDSHISCSQTIRTCWHFTNYGQHLTGAHNDLHNTEWSLLNRRAQVGLPIPLLISLTSQTICSLTLISQAASLGAAQSPLARHFLVAASPFTREGLAWQVQLDLAVSPPIVTGHLDSAGHLTGATQFGYEVWWTQLQYSYWMNGLKWDLWMVRHDALTSWCWRGSRYSCSHSCERKSNIWCAKSLNNAFNVTFLCHVPFSWI